MKLFGTDGVRGRFGEPPLTRPTVTALARRVAAQLAGESGRPPQVILGGDTRESTAEICRWVAAGLAAGGAHVRYAGVIPTPGVAHLVRRLGAAAGIVVSASHNPFPDNGIKLLARHGGKWSDEDEAALEADLTPLASPLPLPELAVEEDLDNRYLDDLAATIGPLDRPLAGLKVVLDTGNGAASAYAGPLFTRLGAEVVLLGAEPDGRNVNLDCGSTAPEAMARRVVAERADLGAAFDGDADRAILADEEGTVRDGDAILYLWATALAAEGKLQPRRVVATTMSNLGLERALARHGIGLVRCPVGDRYVVEAMEREGILLGGEQSGHIVRRDLAATGDGLLTALHMAALRAAAGKPLSAQLGELRRYPQVLLNVPVIAKVAFEKLPAVDAARRKVEETLGDDGRLVLRYSGTEPLARVMIEGPEQAAIEALARGLAAVIGEALGR